jgi:hypothetical protein
VITTSSLSSELREWVEHGLIDPSQAAAIEKFRSQHQEAAPLVGRARVPLLGEALGYLGAALVAVAAGILLADYWDRLLYGARIGLVALLTLVLLGVGALLRDSEAPPAQRLAGFAWALGVGGAAWLAALVAGQDGMGLEEAALAAAISLTALVVAGILWRLRSRWQQQLVTFVAAQGSVVSLLSMAASEPEPIFYGVAVAGLGLVWLLLAEASVLTPATMGRWLGLIGVVAGLRIAPSEAYTAEGLVLGMVVTAMLLATGVLADRPLYMGFGAAAVFLFVPQAVFHFFGDSIGAPAALLLIGLLLLGVAVLVVRARRAEDSGGQP